MALNLFKALPVVHDVQRLEKTELPAAWSHDTITLGWEARLKVRGRRVSDGGAEFATALPRGTVLRADDLLIVESLQLSVRVVEAAEPVFVITPSNVEEAARFAYQIGNAHQPLMLGNGVLICPDVLGMAQVLDYHRIPYEPAQRPFTPVSQAASHHHQVAP